MNPIELLLEARNIKPPPQTLTGATWYQHQRRLVAVPGEAIWAWEGWSLDTWIWRAWCIDGHRDSRCGVIC